MSELERTWLKPSGATPRFDQWELSTLIAYIVANHHGYVRKVLPSILAHTQKLAKAHGGNRPELVEIMRVFASVAGEMTSHMAKEEMVLFPSIAAIENAAAENRRVPPAPFGSIDNPIRMMEDEHESAGAAMKKIRELSGGYIAPDGACTTWRICVKELEAFEQDLHAHVHLENNILFPKARAIASPSLA